VTPAPMNRTLALATTLQRDPDKPGTINPGCHPNCPGSATESPVPGDDGSPFGRRPLLLADVRAGGR
jgi:hypothetical protein